MISLYRATKPPTTTNPHEVGGWVFKIYLLVEAAAAVVAVVLVCVAVVLLLGGICSDLIG